MTADDSPAPSVATGRAVHAELCFHVLSHLELGRDAASLYDARKPPRPWVAPLLEAYGRAPGRLVVQALALYADGLPELLGLLRADRIRQLANDGGRALCHTLTAALLAEEPAVRRRCATEEAAWSRRDAALLPWLLPRLQALRSAAFAPSGRPLRPLRLLDCASLQHARGTHGRAAERADARVIAVAFGAPREQLLCQLLHEELHAITDPQIRAAHAGAMQDTRLDADGFAVHRALERAAVEAGQRLLEDSAPDLLPAYAHWRQVHGA